MNDSYLKIQVKRTGAYFSAEVNHIDLTKKVTKAVFTEINRALCENEVLVFRDQNITASDLISFGKMFGDLSIHPFSPNSDEIPELIVFDNDESNPPFGTDIWHSDETFRDCPPLATCLRALSDMPELGGDTVFASMTAAYDGLSDRMKIFISGLEAVHDFKPFKKLFSDDESGRKNLQHFEMLYPPVTHPVVRVHPITGKKSLFVNPQFTIHIKGMGEDESRSLLTDLFGLAKVPEYQYRHKWYPHTLVVWDNRSVQHYAVHDYWPQRRNMERVTIRGDRPVPAEETAEASSIKTKKSPQPEGEKSHHGGHAPRRQFERAD